MCIFNCKLIKLMKSWRTVSRIKTKDVRFGLKKSECQLLVTLLYHLHWCQNKPVKLQNSMCRPSRHLTLRQKVEVQTQKGMTWTRNTWKQRTNEHRDEVELRSTFWFVSCDHGSQKTFEIMIGHVTDIIRITTPAFNQKFVRISSIETNINCKSSFSYWINWYGNHVTLSYAILLPNVQKVLIVESKKTYQYLSHNLIKKSYVNQLFSY